MTEGPIMWEWLMGWEDDPQEEWDDEDEDVIRSRPHGIILLTPKTINEPEMNEFVQSCDHNVMLMVAVAKHRGWSVLEAWENRRVAPDSGLDSPSSDVV